MSQAQVRMFVFLAIASSSAPLACSSSSDNGPPKSTATMQDAGAGDSAGTRSSDAGTTEVTAGSAGGVTTSGSGGAMGGTGALRPDGGSNGGTRPASSTAGIAGTTGQTSSSLGGSGNSSGERQTGGATNGGTSAHGGTSATGGTSSTVGAGANGGRPASGGATSSGSTGPSDSLCPPGITRTIVVAKDDSGQFKTVQAAITSITSGSSDPIRIEIRPGTYTEKLTIASRTHLCLVGASATTTILSYGDSNASTGGTSTSASVHISADDFSAANLTFQNTYGTGSQAVALRTTGNRQQFLNCRFVGHQDTLYTHNGSQYFKDCYVQGNTDYVFGGATAVLQNCEVRNVENGSAVAAPNTDAGRAYGIVFLGGKFTAASGVQSVGLGRPWGADGFAAYLNVELGAHISAAGFVAMSGNQPQNARFHEYGSTGKGANASSRSSYQLTAAQAGEYTLTKIFGSWTPTYSQ